jgi:hypothetical protein
MWTVSESQAPRVILLDKGNEARRVARDKAAPPPATRKIGDKRRKPEKHKKPLRGDE